MKFFIDKKIEQQAEKLLKQMTLKEKVSLLSGKDCWRTVPVQRLGVDSIVMTDGPHGVRANDTGNNRKYGPSTWFPTGFSMGASWDTKLVGEAAAAMAEETRAYGCDILLGPCINMVRMPLWGRNFETVTEDPYLAGRLAVSYVLRLQEKGVGASVKHYACNNQEENRFRVDTLVDERTLREIYLPHFEMAVKEADPATVMCAYNRINGHHASQNDFLLNQILKKEWGFKGMLISDWGAVHTTVDSVRHGLDVEMPGPAVYLGRLLEDSVNYWQIEESEIDAAALRVLQVVLALIRTRKGTWKANTKPHQKVSRKMADASLVLLKNKNNVLPLNPKELCSLALIGPTADQCPNGGGSSWVPSPYRITPLESLKKSLPQSVELIHAQGCHNYEDPPSPSEDYLWPEGSLKKGRKGLTARYYLGKGAKGKPVETRIEDRINYWRKPSDKLEGDYTVSYSGSYIAQFDGWNYIRLTGSGSTKMWLDNKLVAATKPFDPKKGKGIEKTAEGTVELKRGKAYRVRIEHQQSLYAELHSFNLGIGQGSQTDFAEEIQWASHAAAKCDVAVVCVGFQEGYESEGHDRAHMKLTGKQDQLIEAVAKANPRTIVVVNVGSPIAMPWADKVQGIILAGYAGQEMGACIADVLLGKVNPSGKLPVSFPKQLQDNPSYGNYPGNRQVVFGEGVLVGYRWFDTKQVAPLFCFGHGLSYTSFTYSGLKLAKTASLHQGCLNKRVAVSLTVKNTGTRAGAEVVQLYVGDPAASVSRPTRELKGFAKVFLKPGQSKQVSFKLDHRSLAFFHPVNKVWTVEPGEFIIEAGSSSRDIRLKGSLRVSG